jgi:hypothetical protein
MNRNLYGSAWDAEAKRATRLAMRDMAQIIRIPWLGFRIARRNHDL